MFEWITFASVSFLNVSISWKSLRNPGSHGFFRFFAWEAILLLLLINAKFWFQEPFAWNQIVAWILLLICLVPLVFGVHSLRTRGKPAAHRKDDPALLAFEKTTRLVTSGIYRYIRHPLYSSLFLLTWGIFFKHPSLPGGMLSVLSTVFLVFTSKADEAECIQFFGNEYREYMKHSKRFVPFIY
jgi:protein-S-isoprenylcysteine O-methyltransferase Ste14